jgi:hypothetical protein
MDRTQIKPYVGEMQELKKIIEEFLEQLGFICVSHPSLHYKQIYRKDNLTIHVEEKPTTETRLNRESK